MNRETAEIIDWVVNDRPVHERLVRILKGEDGYSGRRASAKWGNSPNWLHVPDRVPQMADFIEHLVCFDDGSTYRQLYRDADQGGFNSRIPGSIRDSLGPDVWYDAGHGKETRMDAMDWIAVRDDVLRGES